MSQPSVDKPPELDVLGDSITTTVRDLLDVKRLADSTWESLKLINSWCFPGKLSIGDAELHANFQVQSKNYVAAIGLSVITAQAGKLIAEEAIYLCAIIANLARISSKEKLKSAPKSKSERSLSLDTQSTITTAHVQTYIDQMLAQAAEAEMSSRTAQQQFRDLRIELWKLLDPILADQGLEKEGKQAKADLIAFGDHVNAFAEWWITINGKLKSLQTVIPGIKTDGSNPIRTFTVGERWVEVKTKYETYIAKIQEVLDHLAVLKQIAKKDAADELAAAANALAAATTAEASAVLDVNVATRDKDAAMNDAVTAKTDEASAASDVAAAQEKEDAAEDEVLLAEEEEDIAAKEKEAAAARERAAKARKEAAAARQTTESQKRHAAAEKEAAAKARKEEAVARETAATKAKEEATAKVNAATQMKKTAVEREQKAVAILAAVESHG
jgi:hypothetical protein